MRAGFFGRDELGLGWGVPERSDHSFLLGEDADVTRCPESKRPVAWGSGDGVGQGYWGEGESSATLGGSSGENCSSLRAECGYGRRTSWRGWRAPQGPNPPSPESSLSVCLDDLSLGSRPHFMANPEENTIL